MIKKQGRPQIRPDQGKMHRTLMYLPSDYIHRIDAIRERQPHFVTRSAVIRQALMEFFGNYPKNS
jgi:hypothetical protein